MKVTLWGTRGSLPAAGPETVRYGGNTACVEVRGADGTLLVLDAGTGIRRLGATLDHQVSRLDLLLTHLHMDHIQGLGFFNPLYQPGLEVHIWGPSLATHDLRTRLIRYLSPPLFPVRIRDLPCRLTFHAVPRGNFKIGGLEIMADRVCHPGPTFGYRITEDTLSMAYLPDHEPALGGHHFLRDADWTSGFELASGVDLLIHDAQYSTSEYAEHVGWGHSSIHHALEFAAATGVDRLVTFHHDPAHDDLTLDKLIEEARGKSDLSFELVPGTEGASFHL
ncbi:MAG: MBL fold metallo-hydrolase [Nitrospiria bacterium]